MSVAEAGQFYLSVMCKSNKVADSMNASVEAHPFVLAAADRDTALYRDAIKASIQQLSAPPRAWPDVVAADVNAFLDGLYGELTHAASAALSTTQQGYFAEWNAWNNPSAPDPSHVAAQKIRLKLGLSADAVASCGP
ncbi:hypothetical protein AB0323_16640 [Arthrobacter sp. NPDC080031]|uniref:hypothetical protein n=1 Tax=Arthrobacter sp. NPDC080031 TaxID=3155918 RepID=UPI00344C0D5B